MILVFKTVGGRSTAKNYCRVSLLSVVSKVFEKLVNNEIVDHLQRFDLFFWFPAWFQLLRQLQTFWQLCLIEMTSRINLPGTSLERRIRTFPELHFRTSLGRQIGTSPGRQIGTSPGRSNRIFRGRPGDQYLPAGKKKLSIKFHSNPVYDEKYIKAKVWEFNGAIKTNFWGDKIAKEGVHHTYIACICIDSLMRMEKKNAPHVYLEECKYKIKKIKMSEFIDAELQSDSSSDSEWLHLSFVSLNHSLFTEPIFRDSFWYCKSIWSGTLPWTTIFLQN